MQDRDREKKAKAKLYADKKRHEEYSDLVPGDRVLQKQEKQNKLLTPFAPEPHDVVRTNGSSIIIKSPEGVELKRNTAHIKKYEEPPPMPSQTVSLPVEEDVQEENPTLPTDLEADGGKEWNAVSKRPAPTGLETDCGEARAAISTRPVCYKKLPEKFKDFDMSSLIRTISILLRWC